MITFVFLWTVCTSDSGVCVQYEMAAGITGGDCIEMLEKAPRKPDEFGSCQKD